MPQMANITVKNKAGTDVIFVAKVPSAGDKTPAKWAVDAANAIIGRRHTLAMGTRDNGSQNGRIIDVTTTHIITEMRDGVEVVAARVVLSTSGTLPTNVDSLKVSDAFVVHGNVVASTLVRQSAEEGYAPT